MILCVKISLANPPFLVCVCVCVINGMPALPIAAQLDSTREMWHKETSERVRKRLSVPETCVQVLKALLTMAAHERGLVLLEQMAEC